MPTPDRDRRLALYKYDSCGYCRRVMRHLDELGLEVELRDVMMDRTHRAALMAATRRTQVPCLFIDDVALFESADILAWLDAYARRDAG